MAMSCLMSLLRKFQIVTEVAVSTPRYHAAVVCSVERRLNAHPLSPP
jgi:hypothetical protein